MMQSCEPAKDLRGGDAPPPSKKSKTDGNAEAKVICEISGGNETFLILLEEAEAIANAKAAIAVKMGYTGGCQNLFNPDGDSSEPFHRSVSLRSIFGEGQWKLCLVLEPITAGSRNHFYLFS